MTGVVVIGGGHAAAQLCSSLVEGGYTGEVTLVCEEVFFPYHRPPLSKTFIKDAEARPQLLRAEHWYAEAGIKVLLGQAATHIDRATQTITLQNNLKLSYDVLVLATGTRARRLQTLADDLSNVCYLRDAHDAHRLREALKSADKVAVLGGGFIGLEVAATAAEMGKEVSVFESGTRLMQRVASPEVSEHAANVLKASGVALHLSATVGRFECGSADGNADESQHDQKKSVRALYVNETRYEIDLLLVGIGAVPETRLAEAAGLSCDNGIVVDSHMRTNDPAIFAIGDCTVFPDIRTALPSRLESVQNANDQARTIAAFLLGQHMPYSALPWFWSNQGTMRLQIAGVTSARATRLLRPGARPDSFSILHFVDEKLICAESINAPLDHMASRQLIVQDLALDPALLCASHIPLKQHVVKRG